MSSIALQTNLLKAALPFVASNDVRYYLKGLLVEAYQGRIYVVACDGRTMAVTYHCEDSTAQDGQWILPTTEVQAVLKLVGKASVVGFDAGALMLATMRVTPIDGKYPEWRRVLPAEDGEQKPAQLDPEYVARMIKVAKAFGAKTHRVRISTQGASASVAYVEGEQHRAVFIVLPLREEAGSPIADFRAVARA